MRDFEEWLSGFKTSLSDYSFYVDFNKVYSNVDSIKIELNILNFLIGRENIKDDFIKLLKDYPSVLKAVPVLLAKRGQEIYCQDESGEYVYKFNPELVDMSDDKIYEQYAYFMEKTGLFDLLQKHVINNLVDYVTGVETGLDSNGRKNRGGHLMEDLVERYIADAGFVRDESYFKEIYVHDIKDKWNLDLSSISNQGKAEKRFDFVVKTPSRVYGIETNFYNGQGSKLNEVARSYEELNKESQKIDGFTFVWFTDGRGWQGAHNNLEKAFGSIEHIYNIADMQSGIMKKIFV